MRALAMDSRLAALLANGRCRALASGGQMAGRCACARSGPPLRALMRSAPGWDVAARDVYVCVNPNLVAIAADALGPHCAPLVCTDGMPAAAQRAPLLQLARAGARLHYHGDFDWPGIAIANTVVEMFGACTWRFGANDYRAALGGNADATRALVGAIVGARWDGALTEAMQAYGRAIDEEALAHILVPDRDIRLKRALPETSSVLP